MLTRKKRQDFSEDAFMSYNFWLTNDEIKQIEEIAQKHQVQPAIVVQKIVKQALNQLRDQKSSF